MADIEITIKDNSGKVLQELESKMPEILNALGNEMYKSVYNFMTEDKVVDTGRLRGSISYSTPYGDYNNPTIANKANDFIRGAKEKDTVVIGSNVEYASYVNSGTSKQRARKFLETGIYRSLPQLSNATEKILKGE